MLNSIISEEEGKNIENAMISVMDAYENIHNYYKIITDEEKFNVEDVVRESITRRDNALINDHNNSLIDDLSLNREPYQKVLLDESDFNAIYLLSNIMDSFTNEIKMETIQSSVHWWTDIAGISETEKKSICKIFENNININENITEVYLNKSKHDIAIVDQVGVKMIIPAARDAMFNLTASEYESGFWGTPDTDKLIIIRFKSDNLDKYLTDDKTKRKPKYHFYNMLYCKIPRPFEEPSYIPEKNMLVFNSESHMDAYLMSMNVKGEKALKGFIKQKIAEEYFPVAGMYNSIINLSLEQELYTIVLDKCVRIPRIPQSKVEQILGKSFEDKDKIAVLVEACYKEIDNADNLLFDLVKKEKGYYELKCKNLNNDTVLGKVDITSRSSMLEKKYINPFVLSNGYPVFLSEEECKRFIEYYGKKSGFNAVINYLSAIGAKKAEDIAKEKHDFKWNLKESGKSIAKYLGVVALGSIGTWVAKELANKGLTKNPIQTSKLLNISNEFNGDPLGRPKNVMKAVKVIRKIYKQDKENKKKKILIRGVNKMGKLRKTGTSLDRAKTVVDIIKETEEAENKTSALFAEVKAARKDLRAILKDTGEFLRNKITKTLDSIKNQIIRLEEWIAKLNILGRMKTVGSKIKNGAVKAFKFTVNKVKAVGKGIKFGWFWLLTKIGKKKQIANGLRFAMKFI